MKSIASLLFLQIAGALSCLADTRSIPFEKGVRVVEPNQDGIIA